MDSRLRGNDGEVCGNDVRQCCVSWVDTTWGGIRVWIPAYAGMTVR